MVGSTIGFSQSVLKVNPQSKHEFIQHRIGMNTGIRSILHPKGRSQSDTYTTPQIKKEVKKPTKKSK